MSGSPVRTPMAPPPSITTVGMTTYSPNFTVTSSDPTTAASLTNQKMRDSAMLLGV
jgi:hypothetical protein